MPSGPSVGVLVARYETPGGLACMRFYFTNTGGVGVSACADAAADYVKCETEAPFLGSALRDTRTTETVLTRINVNTIGDGAGASFTTGQIRISGTVDPGDYMAYPARIAVAALWVSSRRVRGRSYLPGVANLDTPFLGLPPMDTVGQETEQTVNSALNNFDTLWGTLSGHRTHVLLSFARQELPGTYAVYPVANNAGCALQLAGQVRRDRPRLAPAPIR